MTKKGQLPIAKGIIEKLRAYNRKERDHLIKFALCRKYAQPEVSEILWEKIFGKEDKPGPEHTYVAMDYHLNWLFAALATGEKDIEFPAENSWRFDEISPRGEKDRMPIQGNQEDIDLLVATLCSNGNPSLRIRLIEAKLDSAWTSEQINSKKERLTLIKEYSEKKYGDLVEWQFLLMSAGNPPSRHGFAAKEFTGRYLWMRDPKKHALKKGSVFRHISIPPHQDLLKVERLSATGPGSEQWQVIPTAIKGEQSA